MMVPGPLNLNVGNVVSCGANIVISVLVSRAQPCTIIDEATLDKMYRSLNSDKQTIEQFAFRPMSKS